MTVRVRAYVGLGGNLGEVAATLRSACAALDRLPETALTACSPDYRNAPLGPADQPDYLNAVAALDTALPPHELLHALQAIERDHGRRRDGERWGPRTLDLDLLLYGDERIADGELTVPHPGIAARPFVLLPLAEIAPGLTLPGLGALAGLVERRPAWRIERIDPPVPGSGLRVAS